DGKVFPVSLSAEDVRSVLASRAVDNGFEIVRNESGVAIELIGDDGLVNPADSHCGYKVTTDSGHSYMAENVVIATGGRSYPGTGSDGSMYPVIESLGVSLITPAPALVPVFVQDYGYSALSGISFKNTEIVVRDGDKIVARNVDDLLLTHKNFSGPAVINISRDIRTGMTLTVNYVAPMRDDELTGGIKKRMAGNGKSVANFLVDLLGLPSAFVAAIAEECGVDPSRKASSLTGAEAGMLARAFACHEYSVSGLGGYSEAMVTRGGVALDQIDLKSMECKLLPGIYFIGEVVDIDGDTGGYNLQFAYSSAVAAMKNILE
ncbi:MAG: aminoacetone oxidase family FAD-binding enzyme, partial [Eubacterium sp.]|nr:aminoacetone oxidase family FAD-binding enzyme [Candidatus Colimonas fimequi]